MRLTLAALLLAFCGLAAPARADFYAVSQSATYDPATQLVTFAVQFNQAPDFTDTDQYDRQADSFQYYIYGDPTASYPANFDSIIRGEELHESGDVLRIRNSQPPSSDPEAGGWGSLRGTVPYTLAGDFLTFSAPLSLISDHSTNGHFTYDFATFQYGALASVITSQSTVTPEPGSVWLLLSGALALSSAYKLRGRRHGTHLS